MYASTALVFSLLAALGQALPSPLTVPADALLARSEGHVAPAAHPFAASANHKSRLIRRKKTPNGKRGTCKPKGGPGPVVVHQNNVPANTMVAQNSSSTASPLPAAATTTSATSIAAQVGLADASSSSTASHASASSAISTAALSPPATSVAPSAAPSAAPTSPASSGPMEKIFPRQGSNWWSTADEANPKLSFTGALKPLTAGKLPASGTAPDGSSALVASFPAGTVKLASGQGFSFYTEGEHNNVNVEGAKEVLFSYSVYFQDGFDFVKGGKMPGLYGGTSLSAAKSCSGGRQDGREECFSTRLMWRANGMGEIYNYLPTSVQQGGGYCQIAPKSICDTVYGDSIGRGSYTWATGAWTTVAQRIKLNDVGQANGEQELFVNGKSVMNLSGLQLIVNDAKIYGIMAQTFFGGSDSSWASTKDQSAWFKDWSLTVLA